MVLDDLFIFEDSVHTTTVGTTLLYHFNNESNSVVVSNILYFYGRFHKW